MISAGKVFQRHGAAIENALSPHECFERGSQNRCFVFRMWLKHWRVCRAMIWCHVHSQSGIKFRYEDAAKSTLAGVSSWIVHDGILGKNLKYYTEMSKTMPLYKSVDFTYTSKQVIHFIIVILHIDLNVSVCETSIVRTVSLDLVCVPHPRKLKGESAVVSILPSRMER